MPKKVKKLIFPGAGLMISSYYVSILFAVGIILGYFGTMLFHKKLVDTGKVKLIIFNLGKWKIHLHHWILGILIFFFIYLTNILSYLPIIFLGGLSGLIFHDLYTDKVWYKVIYKEPVEN
jgi:hypothetical protein